MANRKPKVIARGDSGAVSMYQPAIHTKPKGIIARAVEAWGRFRRVPDFAKTSQQGSVAASPATYSQTLWAQRIERAQYIGDLRTLLLNDPRANKACRLYVREAMRDGVRVRVSGENRLSKKAQGIASQVINRLMDAQRLEGWALMLIVEGDLFLQAVVENGELLDIMRMPAAGMERCTDDADRFVDPQKAFAQIDTATWGQVAWFPKGLMAHLRWNSVDGDKYGTPEILQIRRMARQLELLEAAKVTQAMTRSPMRYHWKLGDADNVASPDEVQAMAAKMGFVEGERNIFDPTETSRDIFTNGVTDIDVLEGDMNLQHIQHIAYFQDVMAVGLPTPRGLMNLGAENLNRDILGQLRVEWLKDTVRVNQCMEQAVKFAVELAWMLAGVDPTIITYEILWSKSTTETEKDRIDSVIAMYEAGLMTLETAITMLQPYTRIPSIEEEIVKLKAQAEERTNQEVKKRSAGSTTREKLADEEGEDVFRKASSNGVKRREPSRN